MSILLEDPSPLVRAPALMALGPFLLALPPSEAVASDPPLMTAFAGACICCVSSLCGCCCVVFSSVLLPETLCPAEAGCVLFLQ